MPRFPALLLLTCCAGAMDEVVGTFDTEASVQAQRLVRAGPGVTLGFAAEGRRSPGALSATVGSGAERRLTLDLHGLAVIGEGVLVSVWVKAPGAPDRSRCALVAPHGKGGKRQEILADIPLIDGAWSLLSGWVPGGFVVAPSTTLEVSIPAGVTLLLDDLRLTPSGLPSPPDPRPAVRVAGDHLLAGEARFRLYGMNLNACSDDEKDGDLAHALRSIIAEDYRDLASAGFTCVRLNLWHRAFRDADGWAWLRVHRRWARIHGLRLILDLHSPPGGYQSNDYRGKFWESPEMQQQFLDFWLRAAHECAEDPGIAAFDLLNEPLPPDERTWVDFAARTIAALRAAGWDRPVIVESSMRSDGWTEGSAKLEDPGVIYDAHFYTPWTFTAKGEHPYGQGGRGHDGEVVDAAFLRRHLERDLLAFGRRHRVPVNVGEFGVADKALAQGGDRWLEDVLTVLDGAGAGAQYFCWMIYDDFALHRGWHRQDPAASRDALLDILRRHAGQ